MTGLEMYNQFDVLYDKVSAIANPGFRKKDVEILLNKAQREVLLRYYDSKEKAVVGSFESSELNQKYLYNLLRDYTVSSGFVTSTGELTDSTPTSTSVVPSDRPNGYYVALPEDFLFAVLEEVNAKINNVNTLVRVKPMEYDTYTINIKNPYKKPNYKQFYWRLAYSHKVHEIITDGSTVNYYYLNYIKRPVNICLEARIVTNGNIQEGQRYYFTSNSQYCSIIYNGKQISIGDYFIGVEGQTTFTEQQGTAIVTTAITDCELSELLQDKVIDAAVRIATGTTNPELYQIKMNEENINK